MKILVLNCGSSSIKYQFISMTTEKVLAKGQIERIGTNHAVLTHYFEDGKSAKVVSDIPDHNKAIEVVISTLTNTDYGVIKDKQEIKAVGHRVVHGGEKFASSVFITSEVKDKIHDCIELAPLHNPHNFRGINACAELLPGVPQVAVFDTAFHQTMPAQSYLYALPYSEYQIHNIRRYGFHGTSHRYVSERAAKLMKTRPDQIKVITCHLGNGCSISAIDKGKSVDTSMGFTPLEGLVMGTRCGDIDPAIIFHIASKQGLSVSEIDNLLNKHSGLDGISGISNDMREILKQMNAGNERAKLAVDIFCYRLKKYICSYYGVMNGADALIFTAGIGENADQIREITCSGLDCIGIKLDAAKNKNANRTEALISARSSKMDVFVIPTNEELIIARDTKKIVENMNRTNKEKTE
ncbi:MAG: acetate kinase [bacterium]|nr:acetate kinase [bacterium]